MKYFVNESVYSVQMNVRSKGGMRKEIPRDSSINFFF